VSFMGKLSYHAPSIRAIGLMRSPHPPNPI
jgi:hypothetical protein